MAALRHLLRSGRSRFVLVSVVVAYFALLFALGGYGAWDKLGVPVRGEKSFLDLRSVTTAWECTRRGIDVLPRNPCDPLKRPANYPRLWMALSHLDLGESSTVPLAIGVVAIFLAVAVFALPLDVGSPGGVVLGLAVCSPAVMLGVARANVDLLLFALVVLAYRLAPARRQSWPRNALLLLAAFLKLFPIFATAALLRARTRAALVAFASIAAAFVLYALLTLGDIETIRRVTPEVNGYSYGVYLLGGWLGIGPTLLSGRVWDGLLVALALTVAVAARPLVARSLAPAHDDDGVRVDLFVAGAAIYVCTYALIRSYDYRLAFLLLTAPQLLVWARRGSVLARLTVVVLLATLWLGTPWGGIPSFYYPLQRWQNAIAYHTPFQRQLLSPEAIPQFLLFAALTAALVALLVPARVKVVLSPQPSRSLRQGRSRRAPS